MQLRIWDKEHKRYLEDSVYEKYFISQDGKVYRYDLEDLYNISDRVIIQRSTGLKDRNGVMIFEGDIIQMNYSSGAKGIPSEVEWADTERFDYIGFIHRYASTSQWEYCEIVGKVLK